MERSVRLADRQADEMLMALIRIHDEPIDQFEVGCARRRV
jgi:hypothetical protein